MAQQVIPAAQLVPRFHTIGRCNNYTVLQSIPCSPECKIVGQILLDHLHGYALTATADVPVVYLQQFWRTVSKVPGPEDTIKFMLNTQEFIYTVDMFCDILYLLVETPNNPFVSPVNIKTIEAFMNKVSYQEDYHSIKDDIPLVSMYTTRDVHVRGMLIPDAFLTAEIRATIDFKEYERVFMPIDVPMNQPQPVVSTQGTHRSTPRAYKTPTLTTSPQGKKRKQSAGESISPRQSYKITIKRKKLSTTPIPPPSNDRERDEIAEATLLILTLHKTALAAEAQENIDNVHEKLAEEEIVKMVEGDKEKESYASEFADSILNDDVDDFGTRLEPESHKENTEKVDDDDVEIEKEMKDDVEIEKKKNDKEIEYEKNNDNVEDTEKVVKEKDSVDDMTGSMEIRNEQKQTPIPSPTRSPRIVSSFDKIVSEELTAIASPTTCYYIQSFIHNKTQETIYFFQIHEVLDNCNKVIPDTTSAKTKEMTTQEMPRLVNLAVNKDREVDPINAKEMVSKEFATHGPKMIEELFRKHMLNTTLNLYPTTSTSTARKSSADLQHQLYLNMKSKPQDQAADPEIWEILKGKFKK
ncbi:hypothetical protein Tco_0499982 [Tanacetum coccineum]